MRIKLKKEEEIIIKKLKMKSKNKIQ
jgi:hypothetical protein